MLKREPCKNFTIGERNSKPTIKQLDDLWRDVVKARACYKSEYRPAEGYLCAHHIDGKPNHRLRWELKNGICLTCGQHNYIFHVQGRAAEARRFAMKVRGITEDWLTLLRREVGGTDRFAVKLYLQQELKKYKQRMK